jgi:hypothetical protein|tara:strand:+ start:6485 stop:6706 length:222 start_codon:yes stop_codon:yes gene_type:complete
MNTWPPTNEQILNIARCALNKSTKKDIKVLVYWDNPDIIIYDPIHFAQTDYVRRKFVVSQGERSVEVNIGRQD